MRMSWHVRGRRALVLVVSALLTGLGIGVEAAAELQAASTAQMKDATFRSVALGSRIHFLIGLPQGYETSGKRYPVVYFLHGLPADPTSYQGLTWLEDALRQTGRRAILVIPQGTKQSNGDPEWHDWGPARNWATAIGWELPAYVDAHYRTIANRRGRALVGMSAGGYGASSIGLTHPNRFSVVESWSGYFEPTDPTGTHVLDLGSAAANDAASIHRQAKALAVQFRRHPTFFAFYVGLEDPTFVQENIELDSELQSAGVAHVFHAYPGGHDTSLWQGHAATWLAMALDHLAGPS